MFKQLVFITREISTVLIVNNSTFGLSRCTIQNNIVLQLSKTDLILISNNPKEFWGEIWAKTFPVCFNKIRCWWHWMSYSSATDNDYKSYVYLFLFPEATFPYVIYKSWILVWNRCVKRKTIWFSYIFKNIILA